MNRRTQGFLLLLTGLVAFRLVLIGAYDAYVQPGMRIPLLAASAFLVVLGIGTAFHEAWQADRPTGEDDAVADREPVPGPDEEHHEHRPLVAWLLVLPLAVLLLVAPAPLGADAATRQDAYTPDIEGSVFPGLEEPSDGAVTMRIGEFVDRALWDEGGSLDDATVRLRGFVVHDPQAGDGFVLARFRIACCAADAIPVKIIVRDGGPRPAEDEWLEVTGTLLERPEPDTDADQIPPVEIAAASVQLIEEPASPYE